jgi:hypothetical protein
VGVERGGGLQVRGRDPARLDRLDVTGRGERHPRARQAGDLAHRGLEVLACEAEEGVHGDEGRERPERRHEAACAVGGPERLGLGDGGGEVGDVRHLGSLRGFRRASAR